MGLPVWLSGPVVWLYVSECLEGGRSGTVYSSGVLAVWTWKQARSTSRRSVCSTVSAHLLLLHNRTLYLLQDRQAAESADCSIQDPGTQRGVLPGHSQFGGVREGSDEL